MTNTYTERVVSIESRDGFTLEGLQIVPAAPSGRTLLWIHGVYAAFYAPPGLEVCRALAALGVMSVLGNTRGHNVGAWIRNRDGRVVLAGGAWESFAAAAHDLAGWVEFADRLGPGVVLAGHSLGARKVTMYLATERDPRVNGLILASPSARAGNIDGPSRKRAEELTARGEIAGLLPVEDGWAASAANYLERFAAGSVNDAFSAEAPNEPLLGSVSVPVLALLGGKERPSDSDARAEIELLEQRARHAEAFRGEVIDGADHLYTGKEHYVACRIASWMRALSHPA